MWRGLSFLTRQGQKSSPSSSEGVLAPLLILALGPGAVTTVPSTQFSCEPPFGPHVENMQDQSRGSRLQHKHQILRAGHALDVPGLLNTASGPSKSPRDPYSDEKPGAARLGANPRPHSCKGTLDSCCRRTPALSQLHAPHCDSSRRRVAKQTRVPPVRPGQQMTAGHDCADLWRLWARQRPGSARSRPDTPTACQTTCNA